VGGARFFFQGLRETANLTDIILFFLCLFLTRESKVNILCFTNTHKNNNHSERQYSCRQGRDRGGDQDKRA